MTRSTRMSLPLGLALTLGAGLLQAQPAAPAGQGESQPVLAEARPLAGMNLDFTHGAKLAEVFAALSRQSGISIILHVSASGQEATTSADLRGMSFQRVLDALLLQNNLFYKVMDPNSIMVFKKTPQNLNDFEVKSIKTFYLSHADVDQVRQSLNSIMPTVRVFIDKRLSAVTVSASSGDLASIQQIINNSDRGRGEVRLQMELIEVSQKASEAAGLMELIGTSPSQDPNAAAPDRAVARVMQDADSRLLASPDVRVVGGETAEVRIGRKLGVAKAAGGVKTAKNATTGKADETPQAPSSDDLGVKIKVRPKLHPGHEVSLELEYELTDPLKAGEPGRPNLSEQALRTTVRMKDGGTLVLGGLLEDEAHDRAPGSVSGAKDRKNRLLVVKAVVVSWGEQ